MTVNLDSLYLIPTLLGLTAVNSMWIVKESEAVVAPVVMVVVPMVGSSELRLEAGMPMYWTPTCWRSNSGFLGLTVRIMIRKIARIRRARKEKRRKRQQQQQQPFKEADLEDDDVG